MWTVGRRWACRCNVTPILCVPLKPGILVHSPDLSRPAISLFHCLLINCALGDSHFITKAAYQSIFAKENIFSLERNNLAPSGTEAVSVRGGFKMAFPTLPVNHNYIFSSFFKIGEGGRVKM